MDASLSLNSSVTYPKIETKSPILKDREVISLYTTEQKTYVAGLAALQVLGLLVFGALTGIIIGATCAKAETVIALPGKTEISFTGYVLVPIVAGIAFGVFAGMYLVYKAISDPKRYLEDLADEHINKKAIEIEKEKSPFKKERLQQELDRLNAIRQDVAKAPMEIDSRIYDWAATKIAATLVR